MFLAIKFIIGATYFMKPLYKRYKSVCKSMELRKNDTWWTNEKVVKRTGFRLFHLYGQKKQAAENTGYHRTCCKYLVLQGC